MSSLHPYHLGSLPCYFGYFQVATGHEFLPDVGLVHGVFGLCFQEFVGTLGLGFLSPAGLVDWFARFYQSNQCCLYLGFPSNTAIKLLKI